MKAKLYSALLIAITGLLLGGNVNADGAPLPASTKQDVSAQIQQIRQRISQLMNTAQSLQAGSSVAPIASATLTPEKLNYIQAEVNRIAKETARIKIEVGIYVTLRQIKQKTAALGLAMAATSSATATTVLPPAKENTATAAPVAGDSQKNRTIQDQIAIVRQQIAELTQQLQKKKSEELGQAAASNSATCTGTSCVTAPAPVQTSVPAITATVPAAQSSPAPAKSFWQSAGDFFKKIFTF